MPFSKFRTKNERLRFSVKQSHAWINHSPICTKIVDPDLNLQFMSDAGVNALGIENIVEYYDKPYPFDFYPKSFCDEMSSNLRKALKTGEIIEQEASVVDLNGNEVWFHSTISPVFDENNNVEYLMVVSIETSAKNIARQKLEKLNDELESKVLHRTLELEDANKKLSHLSETDFLTELPNRLAFDRRLNENVATAKRNKQFLSLLMLDIDHFKDFNDKYGHDVGDIVLQKVASAIDSTMQRETDFTARYGGEEFVVLLPGVNTKAALVIAEQVRLNVYSLVINCDQVSSDFCVTISVGVASLKKAGFDASQLVKQADEALYAAKNTGRNNCKVFNS